jgi:ComF family protein
MKNKLLNNFLNLIYPLKCLLCDNKIHPENKWMICKSCIHDIKINLPAICINESGICRDCNLPNSFIDRSWAVCKFEGKVRKSIHLLKYYKKVNFLNYFAELTFNYIDNFINIDLFDIIIPVPMHKSKLKKRGFNQSKVLAEKIAKRYKKDFEIKNLYKTKLTSQQAKLNRKNRLNNLKDAFNLKEFGTYKNKNILLVDDVITTGATLNECGKILKEKGQAKKVFALALAGGV